MELGADFLSTRANGMQCRRLQTMSHRESRQKKVRLLKGQSVLIVSPLVFVVPFRPTTIQTGSAAPPSPLPIALSLTTPIEIVRGA